MLDGKLLLVTKMPDYDPQEVGERYRSLSDIERGLRLLKSDIEFVPVYHRLPDRIRIHALICFLALVLYRVLRMRLKASGNPLSPKRTLEIARKIQFHQILLHHRETASGLTKLKPEQRDLFGGGWPRHLPHHACRANFEKIFQQNQLFTLLSVELGKQRSRVKD